MSEKWGHDDVVGRGSLDELAPLLSFHNPESLITWAKASRRPIKRRAYRGAAVEERGRGGSPSDRSTHRSGSRVRSIDKRVPPGRRHTLLTDVHNKPGAVREKSSAGARDGLA